MLVSLPSSSPQDQAHTTAQRNGWLTPSTSPGGDEVRLLLALAYELRGPVAALGMSTEAFTQDFDTLDWGQAQTLLTAMHRRALWLQGLVENLLSAEVLRTGRLDLHPEPLDLIEVVREVQSIAGPFLAQKRQWLQVSSGGELPRVLADQRLMGQVMLNLVLNATKFSASSLPIVVDLTSERRQVRVAVMNRVPGIPHGTEKLLFQPFYKGPDSKTGLGMGLAIVNAVVPAHHGRVGAENRQDGGACFWFDLPVRLETGRLAAGA